MRLWHELLLIQISKQLVGHVGVAVSERGVLQEPWPSYTVVDVKLSIFVSSNVAVSILCYVCL